MNLVKKQLFLLFVFTISMNAQKTALRTEIGCIDNSDCVPLGPKYACFLYKCLNWVDREEDTGLRHCKYDSQCGEDEKCFRHHNLREVSTGICFLSTELQTCSGHGDCQMLEGGSRQCCGFYCCPEKYFQLWRNISCVSDQECRTWNTGQFCCDDGLCCDDDSSLKELVVLGDTDYDASIETVDAEYDDGDSEEESDLTADDNQGIMTDSKDDSRVAHVEQVNGVVDIAEDLNNALNDMSSEEMFDSSDENDSSLEDTKEHFDGTKDTASPFPEEEILPDISTKTASQEVETSPPPAFTTPQEAEILDSPMFTTPESAEPSNSHYLNTSENTELPEAPIFNTSQEDKLLNKTIFTTTDEADLSNTPSVTTPDPSGNRDDLSDAIVSVSTMEEPQQSVVSNDLHLDNSSKEAVNENDFGDSKGNSTDGDIISTFDTDYTLEEISNTTYLEENIIIDIEEQATESEGSSELHEVGEDLSDLEVGMVTTASDGYATEDEGQIVNTLYLNETGTPSDQQNKSENPSYTQPNVTVSNKLIEETVFVTESDKSVSVTEGDRQTVTEAPVIIDSLPLGQSTACGPHCGCYFRAITVISLWLTVSWRAI